jgi:hypothetical protein
MKLAGITFPDTILALHIAAVMIAFGVTFTYPLLFAYATRQEARHLPAFWRAVALIGQRIVAPGNGVVLAAGIYLATDEHQWSKFYVGWGLAAALALGALGGAFFAPLEKRLAATAERDVAAAGAGPVTFSAEYEQLRRRWTIGGVSSWILVVVTIFFMANHVGA